MSETAKANIRSKDEQIDFWIKKFVELRNENEHLKAIIKNGRIE